MKQFLLFAIISFSVIQSFSQTGSINGKITDEFDNPLKQATVSLRSVNVDANKLTTTDELGQYHFKNVEQGSYTIIVSFVGYETVSKETVVKGGEAIEQNVALKNSAQIIPDITIVAAKQKEDILRLDPIKDTYIFGGKKSEVIVLENKDVCLTEKFGRQIFAKVPGVFVYDMDGTGNQINISTRGLDPHRGWEFNIRRDGIITNSDFYGYPASHYNIPMEAVDHIELVRGTGSLEYGAQFGGMINYVPKSPSEKKFAFESINTGGSFGLVSTYNAISGTLGKFTYGTYFNKKKSNGYRDNSNSEFDAQAVMLQWQPNENLSIKAVWAHSNYVIQLAGPLTDSIFYANPQASTRSRNYYNPDIHVPSIVLKWNISEKTKLHFTTSAILGARNSVMFDKPATVGDTINTTTLDYNGRQVDMDHFNSYTTELRVLQNWKLFKHDHTLAAGVQYMINDLHRQQQGKGTTGNDFDLTLTDPAWGRDMHFKTQNIAVFLENRWSVFKNFTINTGVRYESGESNLSGKISYLPDEDIPNTIKHQFPLYGVSAEYAPSTNFNIYGGWSQAYRPVILKEIIPASVYEVSDKSLEDASGYNAEIGFRGKWKILKWDVSAFHITYNNRLGTLAQTDTANNLTIFRTNIGNSQTNGIEFFTEADFEITNNLSLNIFTSTSYMDARYVDATLRNGSNENIVIDGNKVESVPQWISRNGITLRCKTISFSGLYSYVSETFADAFNTEEPNASGSAGIVPAYGLLDLNLTIGITKQFSLKINASNVLNEHYFTKRPQFYPGPGIWSSDGRSFSATVCLKF